jgi:hypothetical protein
MQDKVLIGSRAIEHHLGVGSLKRSPKDWDYLLLQPQTNDDTIDGNGILNYYAFSSNIASLDEIYTLKVSHSPWVINGLADWHKHLRDIKFLRDKGCQVIEPLHKVAYEQWELRKGAKNVNLNQEKEQFFANSVDRYFEHDSVHEAVALGSKPAFYNILSQGETVKASQQLFEQLTNNEKSRLVFEEAVVLSLERDLIAPYMANNLTPTLAEIYVSYRKQLRLLITQYSKGWWPRWMIENYFILLNPPLNYWAMFMDSDKKIIF